MNPDILDPYFFDIIPLLKKWQRELKVSGITPLCAALNFVKKHTGSQKDDSRCK